MSNSTPEELAARVRKALQELDEVAKLCLLHHLHVEATYSCQDEKNELVLGNRNHAWSWRGLRGVKITLAKPL